MKRFMFLLGAVLLIGCGGSSEDGDALFDSKAPAVSAGDWYKPSVDTSWQWQLTGTINKSYKVDMYDIDLFDSDASLIKSLHDDGRRVICYFSAGSYEEWRGDAGDFVDELLGHGLSGWAGERWLDISNEALAPIMRARLDLAVAKGCDGVEPDNMDGYSNDSGFDLSADDQLAYNKFIANEARKRGLSVGLKNDLNQIVELEPYYDFAVNEQCNQYDECDALLPFIESDKPVFNAEYNSKYIIDGGASQALCESMSEMKLQTLVLPRRLNDAFRYGCSETDEIFGSFGIGFGGSSAFKFQGKNGGDIWVSTVDLMLDEDIANSGYYADIKGFDGAQFQALQQHLSRSKYFTLWVTKEWQESWYDVDKINQAIKQGKIPVFVYWYFGDELVDDMPSASEIDDYYKNNQKLRAFLDKIDGHKLLILEPEFNKQAVLDNQDDFVAIMSSAIETIKDDNMSLSLCITDTGNRGVNQTYEKCGYANCALGDKYEWGLSKPIFDALMPQIDFISFQQMIGQFSRDPSNPGGWSSPNPIAYSDDDIGIDWLVTRVENMADYLYGLYKKPTYLPYITIATATWSDSDGDGEVDANEINKSGYEAKAKQFYHDLNTTKLQRSHMFGYSVMELFDNPQHDAGGYQYFMDNEYHLGIIKSSAIDEIDSAISGDIEFKSDILSDIFGS